MILTQERILLRKLRKLTEQCHVSLYLGVEHRAMPNFSFGVILFGCALQLLEFDKQFERKKYYWTQKKGSKAKLRHMGVVFVKSLNT